jgi:hypothetical protein
VRGRRVAGLTEPRTLCTLWMWPAPNRNEFDVQMRVSDVSTVQRLLGVECFMSLDAMLDEVIPPGWSGPSLMGDSKLCRIDLGRREQRSSGW